MKLEFCDRTSKITETSIFMKIRSGEHNCSIRMDGQADNTKLLVTFRNFANAPRKAIIFYRPFGTVKHRKSDIYSDTWFESWPVLNMLSEDSTPSFLVDTMNASKIV
jgi:hypothetical protein